MTTSNPCPSPLAKHTEELRREIRALESQRKAWERTEQLIEERGGLLARLIRSIAT